MVTLYDFLVFIHILLFVCWLGADMGVAVLGQHFRKSSYSMPERLTILKLLPRPQPTQGVFAGTRKGANGRL